MILDSPRQRWKIRWSEMRRFARDLKPHLARLRHCALCGHGLRPVDPFCNPCWERHFQLRSQDAFVFPSGSDLGETLALLPWPAGDLTTGRLLLSLKGGFWPQDFERLASEFVRILDRNAFLKKFGPQNLCLVPAPPRKNGDVDHAFRWGQTLSQITGIEMVSILQRTSSERDQRVLDRRQRASIQFILQPDAVVDPAKIYIFVDDVLTSGATYRAARAVLSGTRQVWGWFIAYRT